ncbi:MAG: ribose transport system substrate-binding protein [Actinomycetota bacterium]|nr:ribose transport system substrate-binding protein [Actinomycetota bacterium]
MQSKRKSVLLRWVLTTMVLLLVAGACGGGDDSADEPSSGGEVAGSTKADLGGYLDPSAPEGECKLGMALPHFRDPFWVAIAYGAADEARRAGCTIEAVYEAGGYENLDTQIEQVEDLIQLDVDAILFAPNDYEGTAAIADRAADSGTVVINLANMSASEKVAYGVNNYDPAVGEAMADWVAEKNPDAKIAVLSGPAGANWAMDRVKGFEDRIAESHPGLEVVFEKSTDVDRAVAQQVVEDWLVTGDQIDAIIAVAAPLGEGAGAALEAEGREGDTDVLVSTLNEETLNFLEQGLVDYVQSERPVLTGRLGVQLAIKSLNGEEVDLPSYEALTPLPPKILYIFDAPVYTSDDVGSIETSNDMAPEDFDPSDV